jgi:hypothetical protein
LLKLVFGSPSAVWVFLLLAKKMQLFYNCTESQTIVSYLSIFQIKKCN